MKNPLQPYIKEWKKDYRHILCTVLTVLSLCMGILFPNSLPRLAETVRDLGVSVGYYFANLFSRGANPVRPTVLQMPSWQFAEQIWEPVKLFPYTWEEFKAACGKYFDVLFTKENFLAYWYKLGDLLFYLSRFSLILVPLLIVVVMRLKAMANKRCTDRNKVSKPLQIYEKFVFKYIYPMIAWCKDFVIFCKENSKYPLAWLTIWALHFNIFSIFIGFTAYYFYFSASWNIGSLYGQLLKLVLDLTPVIRFLPGIVWACIFVWFYNYICRSMAFNRLYHAEHNNRAFLKERGIITTIYGEPGIGKTEMVKSMALSSEIQQFDDAFGIMLRKDMMFPNFPWQRLRDELKKRIENRTIVDTDICAKWVRKCRRFFDYIQDNHTAEEWKQLRKRYRFLKMDYTFGYDYDHYRTSYNDELKITHLFEAIESYACAYLIFTVKTSLLFANFSIRTDSILTDLGNLPSRDNDFFNRDPLFQEAYSKHAHIIDFDMIRLGKKMIKDNPKARRLSFGTYVITEIDKEFKNMQELKEMKISAHETNQKNDLHNACLMMCRHAVVVDNIPFIRILCDLQRPEGWGAGGRELGEVIYIKEKSELAPVLPILSPYWLCQGIFSCIKEKWDNFKGAYDVNRSDKTLFTYLGHNLTSLINNHYDRVEGLFGAQTMKLEIQSGRLDGEVKKDKWRILTKKDRSRRYKTSCLEAVFESYTPNTMHIDDFVMYAGEVGTQAENDLQNSYFQNDIKKMKALNF